MCGRRRVPSMVLPSTPRPPRQLVVGEGRLVLVDTEGGLTLLHPERGQPLADSVHPFAGELTHAVLLNEDALAATWVEREVGVARMAVLDLGAPLESGPALPDLRAAVEQQRLDQHQVAGATWSHVLDAEPLAICAHGQDLVFSTHRRGIYRVSIDAEERWRIAPPAWSRLEHLQDASVVVDMHATDDAIWLFSLGGGWAELDADTGEVRREGTLALEARVQQVWRGDGEWLLALCQQRFARWRPADDISPLEVMGSQGPVRDAIQRHEGWCMTGWREDLFWGRGGLRVEARGEIGVALHDHPQHGLIVLDNMGHWTPFAHAVD